MRVLRAGYSMILAALQGCPLYGLFLFGPYHFRAFSAPRNRVFAYPHTGFGMPVQAHLEYYSRSRAPLGSPCQGTPKRMVTYLVSTSTSSVGSVTSLLQSCLIHSHNPPEWLFELIMVNLCQLEM